MALLKLKHMKRSTIISSSPYGDQTIPQPLTRYVVRLESESGYSEEHGYACTPEERDATISQALDAFCEARAALEVDPLAGIAP